MGLEFIDEDEMNTMADIDNYDLKVSKQGTHLDASLNQVVANLKKKGLASQVGSCAQPGRNDALKLSPFKGTGSSQNSLVRVGS